MLAIWLPVSQHCGPADSEGETGSSCGHDTAYSCNDACFCHAMKSVSLNRTACTSKLLPPPSSSTLTFCLIHLLRPQFVAEVQSDFSVEDPPEVQVLHSTWPFARRSALPARAPDFQA
jgi:hypothetical protein